MSSLAAFVGVLLAGCAAPSPCAAGGSGVLATHGAASLSCDEAAIVPEWARRVAGRRPHPADRDAMRDALGVEFAQDPARTRARLAAARSFVDAVAALGGVAAAERRGTEGYAVVVGDSPVTQGHDGLGTLTTRTMSVWSRDSAERLVLTEADIEGWMRFASLCREQQGAPPLKTSIADRVTVYKLVIEAFDRPGRAGKLGLIALGGAWPAVEARWPSVSYEQQQRWVQRAPFPPPMEATSLGYVEALAATDWAFMAESLFLGLGDLPQQPAD